MGGISFHTHTHTHDVWAHVTWEDYMYNVGAYARPISFIYLPRRPGDARRSEQTARVRTVVCENNMSMMEEYMWIDRKG